MIVVDTSVWIDWFNGTPTPEADTLDGLLGRTRIVIGDLILVELLQGFQPGPAFDDCQRLLEGLEYRDMVGRETALAAVGHYRRLRGLGVTPRKTMDLLIAAFCLRHGFPLLHRDRDFDACETHLGLAVVR